MASSKCFFTLALLTTVTGLLECAHGFNISPVITSTNLSEVVVNPGENYTITCEGDTSMIWKYPNMSDSEPIIHESKKNGKYVSFLELTNISYKAVGYYHCLLGNNSEKNSSIYLYVKDENILLTNPDIIFAPIHGTERTDIIIPCKPTHPEVNVTLCQNFYEKLRIGENEDAIIGYDPKVGFILENAQLKHNGLYACCTLPGGICSIDDDDDDDDDTDTVSCQTYALQVLVSGNYLPRPAIDETNLQHVKVGDNVTIECRITVTPTTRYNLEWIVPNKSDHITVGNTVIDPRKSGHHLSTGRLSLKIFHATLEDTGNYTCKVKDYANNVSWETIYLNIFSK